MIRVVNQGVRHPLQHDPEVRKSYFQIQTKNGPQKILQGMPTSSLACQIPM